jgi:predicted TIM-barrel fold metal-dependent hydrolase
MIIDTHVHLYGFPSLAALEKKIARMEDAIGFRTRYPELYAATLTDEPVDITDGLIADMDRHGIDYAVVQARAGNVTNDQVAAAVKRHPKRLVGLLRMGHDQEANHEYLEDPTPVRERAPDHIAYCIEQLGMRGIGETFIRAFTTSVNPERIEKDLRPIMDTLNRYKMPIQFPTAWSQFPGGLFYGNPIWADEVAGHYPDVPVILTKMGRSLQYYFEPALTVAMRNSNVYFDVVGTSPAHLRQAIDAIGSERIMFGSDWSATWRWLSDPADLYTIRKRVLDAANLSDEERENIMWRTANRVFGLNIGGN